MGEKNYPSEIFSDEAEEIKLKAGSESVPEKDAHALFKDFLNAETLKEKIDALCKISEAGAVDDELLDWISNISPDYLESMEIKLWQSKNLEEERGISREDSVDYLDSVYDDEISATKPIIDGLAMIIKETKNNIDKIKAESALLNLLKNWNSFEARYFQKMTNNTPGYKQPKNDQEEQNESEEIEKELIKEEYDFVHLLTGYDYLRQYVPAVTNSTFISTKENIINAIIEVGSRTSIDALIEIIVKGRRSAHNIEVGEAFEKIDGVYAEQKLFPLLADNDIIIRENAAAIIFRLNFYDDELNEFLGEDRETKAALEQEYGKTVYQINQEVNDICKLCGDIFFEKQLDKNQVIQAILREANSLLVETVEKIKTIDDGDENKIIQKLIEEFKRQQIARKQMIDDFKETALELNRRYADIYKKYDDLKHEQLKHELWTKELGLDDDDPTEPFGDYADYLDAMREMEYHPATAWSLNEAEELIREKEKIDHKFDSERIKNIIEETWQYSGARANRDGKISDFREELESLLKYQKEFEKKLEQIVYGQESAILPEEFTKSLSREIESVEPERLPANEPLYFPVGISKELPEWQRALDGDQKTAKPIDMYGYLFWLQNQGRPAELVICDEIQTVNYKALYPDKLGDNPELKARELARKIGQKEKKQYQKIIDAFGLNNIKIVDYREFIGKNEEKINKYGGLCARLSKNPIFAESFLLMVQESVSQSMAREQKEKFLPYALEELSWILGNWGTKVSHINEARYDVLAAVIKNTETYAEEHSIDIYDPQNEAKLTPIINGVLGKLNDRFNARKSSYRENNEAFEYYKKAEQVLKKLRRTAGVETLTDLSKNNAVFPFAVPQTGSQSFGWRSGGDEQEAVVKFREPYSTYFYKNSTDLFLESDQVVAAEGHIAGKILTLPAEAQKEYAEKVIRPILIHFFKVLENAPEEYFQSLKKTKEELLSECEESRTLIDFLKFIQQYIVKPAS